MRAAFLVTVTVVAVACGQAEAETQTSAEESRRAHLAIVSSDPLVVRGTRFKAGERVKLLVTVGGRAAPVGAARASQAGRFTARLRAPASSSDAVIVQAIGARGSRAMTDQLVTTDTLAPGP